ncbi:MAG: hypothetical protein ACUVWR_19265, partial [Anaerolineae bacterium]
PGAPQQSDHDQVATRAAAGRAALPEVSKRLGHAHSGITAQVYSHALAGDDSAATAAISRALTR